MSRIYKDCEVPSKALYEITTTTIIMKCSYCAYEWESRTVEPKACPRCKRRLDFPRSTTKDPLARARNKERGFERTVFVMSIITPRLEEKGIKTVIVGGSAVEFYTKDQYATGDIDLAINRLKRTGIDSVLADLLFKKVGRMWVREDLALYIETPGDIRDIDMGKVTKVETEEGYAYIIGLEDIILDRILAAEHWKSEKDKEQAIQMASSYWDSIDWKYVREKSKIEKAEKMLDEILEVAKDET